MIKILVNRCLKLIKLSSICLLLLITLITTIQAQQIGTSKKQIPVLDKTKSYPSKKLEFKTDTTYVRLETSKDVLMDGACKLRFVSEKKLVFSDEIRGDVFIFDINGNILSSFNQKSGLGYTFITFVAYDEQQKELFILDRIKKKIFVFSENGTLLRSFRTPKNTHIQEIYNFDNNSLLAFSENEFGSNQPSKPYLFIDKNVGEIIDSLDIATVKENPFQYIENTGENSSRTYTFTHGGIPDNCKFGNDYILANKSMDTVYLLNQNKSLIPLFSQTPSVHSESPKAASVGFINDEFLTICVADYDIQEGVKIMKTGRNWKPKHRFYFLDRKSGEFFEDPDKGKLSVHKIDTPKDQDYRIMQAINLIKANKKGMLTGELKEIASQLDIGDNPVIRIIKGK